ncbi:uncharacterized protein [Temnothorax nylanderi]|uniref:uncharacterized protein isoform X2 n=1 Tax=Temnothorax nylanderi TaxID=102681 RepID=UPI003A8BC6DD
MLDILRGLNIYPVLVSSKLSKHTGRKYICDRCLHYFSSSDKLQSHTADCREVNYCAIRLPSEDNKWLSFKNHSRKERLPFVVYADLECVLKKTQPETEHAPYAYQHHRVTRAPPAVSNDLSDSVSCFTSAFTLEWHGPRVLAQHIDDDGMET